MNKPVLAALLIAASLTLNACSRDSINAQETAAGNIPPASVATPLIRDVAITQSYPAQLEAISRVELRPQVAGYLDAVTFTEGAAVSRGQLLFRIDPRPWAAALAEAEAALIQAEADAEAMMREGERAARLVARSAISHEDADRRTAAAKVSSARVAAARAAVERARLNLSFTEIRSPISGRIGRAEVTRGNLVSPETRLAVIVGTDPLYVRFDVDENALASHLGSSRGKWKVEFNGRPAEVAFVENEIGHGTGTLRIRAKMSNPDATLIPGMYGTVQLTLGNRKNAILIREEAIGSDQGQRFVLVVDAKNTLQYRAVTPGARNGDLRVIDSGLSASDRVVVNGLFRLRPGMTVAPALSSMESKGATEKEG